MVWTFWRRRKSETLIDATYNADLRGVRSLLRGGADPNVRDFAQMTPLHRAVQMRRPDIASLLIEYGADVNARAEGDTTPLHCAVSSLNPAVARLFRQMPGWSDVRSEVQTVELLLKHNADTNVKDDLGQTPLQLAVACEKAIIVKLLLDNGADCDDRKALNWAVKAGSSEIIALLKKYRVKHGRNP